MSNLQFSNGFEPPISATQQNTAGEDIYYSVDNAPFNDNNKIKAKTTGTIPGTNGSKYVRLILKRSATTGINTNAILFDSDEVFAITHTNVTYPSWQNVKMGITNSGSVYQIVPSSSGATGSTMPAYYTVYNQVANNTYNASCNPSSINLSANTVIQNANGDIIFPNFPTTTTPTLLTTGTLASGNYSVQVPGPTDTTPVIGVIYGLPFLSNMGTDKAYLMLSSNGNTLLYNYSQEIDLSQPTQTTVKLSSGTCSNIETSVENRTFGSLPPTTSSGTNWGKILLIIGIVIVAIIIIVLIIWLLIKLLGKKKTEVKNSSTVRSTVTQVPPGTLTR